MARISRKKTSTAGEPSADSLLYRTGFYLRLSDRDGKEMLPEENSGSIENQRRLLLDFIRNKPEFQLISVFVDDGETGTNFQRKGFEQMMKAARNGEINCIIVKDLSRFGRNYLETGYYIEYIFPFLQVRFIAVTDGFDTLTATAAQLSYLIPLKNLMNENYAVDISKKERSAKKILRKKGCFIGAHAMYGYEKTEDKHRIKIDPEAAVYVRMIFHLGEQGISDSGIAKCLNQQKILCPARYKYEKGRLKHEKYAASSRWYPQTVAGILSSRIYIGDMVQGKQASGKIRGKKKMVSQEDWDIVCGTHEAIITKEQFERVQKIRQERHKYYQKMVNQQEIQADNAKDLKDKRFLQGKLYCGDCKKAMVRKQVKGCKDPWRYICEIYERTGTCSRKYVLEQEIYEGLEYLVRRQIEVFGDFFLWEREIRQEEYLLPEFKQQLGKFEQKLRESKEKQEELARKKALLYRQWKEGKIDQEEYIYQKSCCCQEIFRWEKEEEEWGNDQKDKIFKPEIVGIAGFNREEGKKKEGKKKKGKGEEGKEKEGKKGDNKQYLPREWMEVLISRIEVFEKDRIKVYFTFGVMG